MVIVAAMAINGVMADSSAVASKHNKKWYDDFSKFGFFTVPPAVFIPLCSLLSGF